MRIINEINHPSCKITIFSWNNRYLIKFEQGLLEQTYKINQFDVTSEQELNTLLSESFINEVLLIFQSMALSINKVIYSH